MIIQKERIIILQTQRYLTIFFCNLHISLFSCNLNSSMQHTLVVVLYITLYSSIILSFFLLCITFFTREFSDLNNSLWLPLFINSTFLLSLSLSLSLSHIHTLPFFLSLFIFLSLSLHRMNTATWHQGRETDQFDCGMP